jgi:hypothetical protein
VFHQQSYSSKNCLTIKRSNSALLPKDVKKLNRIQDIAPHLPRESGVFVEVILNSVAVVIQSSARSYIATKKFRMKLEASRCIQRNWRIIQQRDDILMKDLGSSRSRSSYRMSTHDENRAILKQIYQKAESQTMADSRFLCLSQFDWRLVLAIEQELKFDGYIKSI